MCKLIKRFNMFMCNHDYEITEKRKVQDGGVLVFAKCIKCGNTVWEVV